MSTNSVRKNFSMTCIEWWGRKGGSAWSSALRWTGGWERCPSGRRGPGRPLRRSVPDDGRGLYKAYLRGRGGSVLLGTMTPENGRLLVRRTFSLDELRRRGAWPVLGGAAELAFSFRGEETPPQGWVWEEGDGLELGERTLRQSASRLGRILCRREGEELTLACPFDRNGNFPFRSSSVWGASRALGAGASCSFPLTGAAGPSCGKHE